MAAELNDAQAIMLSSDTESAVTVALTQPLGASAFLSSPCFIPRVLETLQVWEAPSPSLSPRAALNLIACVPAGKTSHFDQFVFSQQSILWLTVVWQEKKRAEAARPEQFYQVAGNFTSNYRELVRKDGSAPKGLCDLTH